MLSQVKVRETCSLLRESIFSIIRLIDCYFKWKVPTFLHRKMISLVATLLKGWSFSHWSSPSLGKPLSSIGIKSHSRHLVCHLKEPKFMKRQHIIRNEGALEHNWGLKTQLHDWDNSLFYFSNLDQTNLDPFNFKTSLDPSYFLIYIWKGLNFSKWKLFKTFYT